jgi:hypothetical protein
MAQHRPRFIQVRDQKAEFYPKFPNMMKTLWEYIETKLEFPTQDEFVMYFIDKHGYIFEGLDMDGVEARVRRTYPSIAREIHFCSLAYESSKFDKVEYSLEKDIKYGVDAMVDLGGNTYNVCLFVNTKRGQDFRTIKKTERHAALPNTIELALDLHEGKQVNGWSLFTDYHVDQLLNHITNYAWQHYQQHPLELIG